ncbi:MAG: DUF1292 domain-containing protein [Lachnospiraceae bacterium]
MEKNNATPEEEDLLVTLELDDGSESECRVLTIFEAGERDYIVLLPLDEDGNDNEEGLVYIYRYSETDDGDPILENIESDEEYELVSDAFDELVEVEEIEDEE